MGDVAIDMKVNEIDRTNRGLEGKYVLKGERNLIQIWNDLN